LVWMWQFLTKVINHKIIKILSDNFHSNSNFELNVY